MASFGWKFAAMADSRGSDNGINNAVLTALVNRINQENVDLVIFPGDAVTGSSSDATTSSQMDTWIAVMNGLNCPWYWCPGNHEIQSATVQEAVLRGKVTQPENGPASDKEMAYSFDYQNAHFVALNSDHYGQGGHVQRSWLAGDLSNCSQPHIFVFAHRPAYSPGSVRGLDIYPDERDDFWNILSVYGAGMYFCGHDHLYKRSSHGSVIQIISGGAGAPLDTGIPGTIAQYHYVVVTVEGNGISAVCKDLNGGTLDSWSYTVTPAVPTDCASAKMLPDGTKVTIRNKIVTCVRGSAIYVEEDDRSAAFRAAGISGISVGDRVNITGTLQTNSSGEREIMGAAMRLSSGNPIPDPVVMSHGSLIGGPAGYNPGAPGATGCNTSSLFVKVSGKVTKVGTGPNAGLFYLDDGSNLLDGTSWDGTPNVGVRVSWGGTVTLGEHRIVTGICSAFKNGQDVCRLIYSTDRLDAWTAYNDVVYSSNPAYGHPPLQPNVTTINIGAGSPGPSSGMLKDFTTGADTGVTAALSQSGGVTWQPDPVSGGTDCNIGTDARNTFGPDTASLNGVVYYGSTGWYVDLTLTGLDPSKRYEFATSANRNNNTYTDRYTKYTLMGASSFTNSSTPGVSIGNGGASSTFLTGYNTVNGYVARWTNIDPGPDGSFTVRAEAGSAQYKAYAFSAFKLQQLR